jgi:hypothetical protein
MVFSDDCVGGSTKNMKDRETLGGFERTLRHSGFVAGLTVVL